jgi:hypothetical protein
VRLWAKNIKEDLNLDKTFSRLIVKIYFVLVYHIENVIRSMDTGIASLMIMNEFSLRWLKHQSHWQLNIETI